tara:strand:+ start:1 stop:1536 length:1536 start_codon:yes stop_codon:yes gene_type:complete
MVIFDNQIPELDSVYIDDQNGFRYTTNDFYSVLNITSSTFGLNMSIDVKEWCLNITKEDSIIDEVLEICRTNENMPEILVTNQSGLENTRNIPIQVNLSNISDGDYLVDIYLIDWAGNSAFEEFNLFLDRSIPIIDWMLSPSNNKELFDHRQVMNWASNEFSHVYFTHNGEQIEEWEGYGSESSIILQDKGLHEFCIIAYDSTEGQYNENILVDCQTYELNESIYSTNVVAPWNGGITTEDTLSAVLYRGPDQEIWWQNDAEEELFLITPGAEVVELYFTLKEGMNEFSIEIESLDEMHDYQLYITRDTIAPVLSFEQISIRNSTLNPVKNIEGNCEPGAYVMIWSVIESHEFICDASGIIDIEISVQDMVGSHVIQGTTTDAVNNRNSFSIEVINQNWIDWAIDDAQDQGPMLWYFLATLFAVLILISITVIGRKSLKKKKLNNKNLISLEESFNEINELLNSPSSSESEIDWGVVNSDLPEAEELRSWKEPTRSIHSINQSDDEVIDLD